MPRAPTFAGPKAAKQLSRRVFVVVSRDAMTKTPRVIWQHEFPILEAIFGEGNVLLPEPSTLDEGYSAKVNPALLPHNKKQDPIPRPSESVSIGYVFIDDPRTEFERLVQVYGMHPDVKESMCENVYGRFQSGAFSKVVGSPEVEDLPEQQLRDLAKAHGYLPSVGEKSSEAEKAEASAKHHALQSMGHDELVKLAAELEIAI